LAVTGNGSRRDWRIEMEAFEKWWEKNHLEEKGYGALRGLSKDIWRAALKWAKSRGDRLTDT
jgi:hypothetical protein